MKKLLGIIVILMAMYNNLNAEVKIGSVTFKEVNSCEITQSVIELSDQAIVVLPRNYKNKIGESVLDVLKVGQKISISLGYNDELNEEFKGYVREIESDIPIKIHIDDEMYQFKKNNLVKSWKKVTLQEVLTATSKGMEIDCPEVNLGKFIIDNESSYKVFMRLKHYGLFTYVKDDVLHCGFPYKMGEKSYVAHEYEFGRNVKENKLKYRRKEDIKLKVVAIANKKDGKKIKVELGSGENDAIVRTMNFGDVDETQLRTLANAELNKLCFDGYSGKIIGFGVPLTRAGDTLRIIDEKEKDREGNYLIESVKIRWGNAYFERINQLSYKV